MLQVRHRVSAPTRVKLIAFGDPLEAMSQRDCRLPLTDGATEFFGSHAFPHEPAASHPSTTNSTVLLDLLERAFSFPAMLGVFLVGLVFYATRCFTVDPDMWWHIKAGQDILALRHFPTSDPYSFTVPGAPWIAYEWLGEVIFGFAARWGGLVVLDFLFFALTSVLIVGLYYLAALRSGNCKAAFIATAAVYWMTFVSLNMRPQMLGYLFLAYLLFALEVFRKGTSGPIWLVPFVFLFWVNVHGTFIIGIAVLTVSLISGLRNFRLGSIEANAWTPSQRMKLEAILLLSLAVLPVTPYGTQIAFSPFQMAFNQPLNLAVINEWRPMPFDILGGKLFLAFIVIFIVLQMLYRFTWRLDEFLFALGAAALACLHVRFLMLFVLFFVPLLAAILAAWVPPYQRALERYAFNAALMSTSILTMVYYHPTRDFLEQRVADTFPAGAVRYLDQHVVPAPIWNSYGFGGYLIANGRKVFIDGRGDIYERGGVLSDYMALTQLKPGTFSILDRYNIQSCLVTPKESLTAALLLSPNWKRVYADNTSVLFIRTSSFRNVANHP